MTRYFGEFHIVRNFPSEYIWPKKVLANIMYFFAAIHPQPRDNWLDSSDQEEVESLLELGDVLLLGNLRTVFSKFCEGPFTHSGVYCDNARIVNCVADGVGFKDLNQIYREYDTLAVLRLPQDLPDRQRIIQNCLSIGPGSDRNALRFFLWEAGQCLFLHAFCQFLIPGSRLPDRIREPTIPGSEDAPLDPLGISGQKKPTAL